MWLPPEASIQKSRREGKAESIALKFVEYSKMIYLDGDIQVYDNIDHLFDLPDGRFYAVMDCFCEKTWSHTPQSRIGYCQQCPDKVSWPAEMGQPPSPYFNAGMFVFEPSIATYHDLLKTLKVTPPTPFAEQRLFDKGGVYFKDIYSQFLCLQSVLGNAMASPRKMWVDKVQCFHYCRGLEALEIHWQRREHAERGYKDAGEEMVGHLQ
ncbi:hypothetical protein POTOM_008643 [Populus tomentosa]|uniref:Hexosyltransferase n=1 Tax=Populus tomentosa TaxID=118781 RepID=A0A8X8AHR5_POPTO|nr:hypothetical protein POTOM_008643 [Populus tomentosa]